MTEENELPTKKKKKTPIAVLFQEISSAINGTSPMLPPFFEKFMVIEKQNGIRHVIQEIDPGSKIVKKVDLAQIISTIARYIERNLAKHDDYRWDIETIKRCANYWVATTEASPEPKTVAELSEDEYCYHRIPFDAIASPDKTPLFSEFLSRTTNADALVIWLGSLFFEWSSNQQYVWLYGDGLNGKSSIARLFFKCFGQAAVSEDANMSSNRFWTAGFVNKRLAVFPDCNNPTFVTSGLFKSLTGDDYVRIENKGEKAYSEKLNCKFLMLSNESPIISSGSSDMRRAIYCEVGPISGASDKEYEENLWLEAPYIIGNCKKAFLDFHGNFHDAIIPTDIEGLKTLAEESEQALEHLFYSNFKKVYAFNIDDGLTGVELQSVFKRERIYNLREQNKFIRYMMKKFGVKKKRMKYGVIYTGVRTKSINERVNWDSEAEMERDRRADYESAERSGKIVEKIEKVEEPKKLAAVIKLTKDSGKVFFDEL